MLVLGAELNDVIHLDNGTITVTVVRIDRDKIRLGFTAPGHVDIIRGNAKRQQPQAIRRTTNEIPAASLPRP